MASAPPDLGDLRWFSMPRRSIERKRISTRNIIPLVNTFRSLNSDRHKSYPIRRRPSLVYYPNGECGEKRSLDCALAALATLNDEKINQGPKFELVKPLGCMVVSLTGLFHCNFIARPIGGSEADEKLYFAAVELDLWEEELAYQYQQFRGDEVPPTPSKGCSVSYIGPPGSKTGLYGCRSCNKIRGYIQHPKPVASKKKKIMIETALPCPALPAPLMWILGTSYRSWCVFRLLLTLIM